MKKQLLFVLAFVASSLSLSAQTWNFEEVFPDVAAQNPKSKSYTETTTVEGLTIYRSEARHYGAEGAS